ncbi:arylsulfatase [Paracoccus sp. PAR01]|uniref:arylsulfatase n=1 Tax=Paracoccus sp. PAR01 TaxID=2769282 RepID=UPI001780756C|nr:arylsulfatase [Paracoccus sp. PAR01]MBD9529577.1 arylsulfatase [Paracoccus sp. PAR01]
MRNTFFSGGSVLAMLLAAPALAQNILPFPEQPGIKAERTMQLSTYERPAQVNRLPANAPNILIIMLDDVGPALPSAYGGVINTPTLARVAESGVSYNRFHNSAMCSPTRASLLTGRNPHRIGFGQIAEFANNWDGYSGAWPANTASVAKVLGYYGYATSAFGKWHNTPSAEISRMGPYDRWPTGRLVGFDYFYGFLAGEASQWEPAVVENTTRLDLQHGESYHFTEDMTSKALAWLRNHNAVSPDQPFMMYWAPGASHGPHQIFKEWADKYKGRFDEGWDELREKLFEGQKAAGWLPEDATLTPRPDNLAGWDSIPEDERDFQRRLMEVYAGFTEHADTQAGLIIDELEKTGKLDNTLIFYVWGDNGSSAEGQNGTIAELLAQNGIKTEVKDHIRVLNEELGGLDALGGHKTDNMYHAGWAWAGSAPYQSLKLVAAHFGGTRTPLAVSWPKSIEHDGQIRSQFYHVNDIVPTIYDILDITPPGVVDGVEQSPIDGVSMLASLEDAAAPENKPDQFFEVMGSRSYYKDGWIASVMGPRIPWVPGIDPKIRDWNPDDDTWELYNLNADFSQSKNIAAENPEKLVEMIAGFDTAAQANSAYPVGGGLWSMVLHPEDAPHNKATSFTYSQDTYGIPEGSAAGLGTRSNLLKLSFENMAGLEGVLYALGAYSGGVALWLEDGKLTYEYNKFMIERTRLSTDTLPEGKIDLEVESVKDAPGTAGMNVVIRVNGQELASGRVPETASIGFTPNDSFDVGRDTQSPVSSAYYDRAPFAFTGKIDSFTVDYLH